MGIVTCDAEMAAKISGEGVVVIVIRVKTVGLSAPGIEPPIDAAYFAAVCYKGRAGIPRPGVVDRNAE